MQWYSAKWAGEGFMYRGIAILLSSVSLGVAGCGASDSHYSATSFRQLLGRGVIREAICGGTQQRQVHCKIVSADGKTRQVTVTLSQGEKLSLLPPCAKGRKCTPPIGG